MEIIIPPNFISSLSHKYLLIDTNVFRDAAAKPTIFTSFFNALKKADVTIATIDEVRYELLKGSADEKKYKEKEIHLQDIVDITLPLMEKTYELVYEVIKLYRIDGTALSITDLILGASLMQYESNIFLMTRDTTDFIQGIFNLSFVLNLPHGKGIHTYGVYQYTK